METAVEKGIAVMIATVKIQLNASIAIAITQFFLVTARHGRKPSVVFSLHSGKKTETNPDLLKQDFHELLLNYADYQHIYTDGSKDKEKVGCAVLRENDHQTMRIPDGSSIFTAEAKAIDLALDLVDNCNSHDKFIVFSDSFSVLQALNHTSSKNPQIQNILQNIIQFQNIKL